MGRSLSEDFLSKFPHFFFANFLVFPYFPFFFLHIGMRSLPNILPSVKFQNFEMFPVFLGKKKREFGEKIAR